MERLLRDEKGYILIVALVVLILVGLISGAVLSYMVSGLRAGHTFETGAAELYAADAGVEEAVWRIENATEVKPPSSCGDPEYWAYNITDVNGRKVQYSITYLKNDPTYRYFIESTATGGGSGTTVESYVKFTPGAELNIFSGALASATTITLGKDSTVNGDVYHCGVFDPGNGSTINGTDQGCAPFPDASQNLAFANAFKDDALKGGTWPATDLKSSTTLGPKYIDGDLTASRDVTITLAGTVYVKGSIRFENTITITGSGSLVAEGDIYFKKLANYTVTGDSIIMTLSEEGIYIKKSDNADELVINALIYAPNGPIKFDKDTTVFGGVVGETIVAAKEGSFTFVPKTSWDFPGGLPGGYTIETYSVTRSH